MHHLIRHIDTLVTMDSKRRELHNVDVRIQDGVITEIGTDLLNQNGHAQEFDGSGTLVTPGLVNTHHHLFQTMTRAVPKGQDALLFGWLQALYPIWSKMGPEHFRISAEVGLAELVLSGCTLASDHMYLFPNGARLEDTIEAAENIGVRLHATRGAMSIGESDGGLPPDSLVENEADILKDCIRLIDGYHDASAGAMIRIAVAPCSPFSVSRELMRDAALLARDKGVMMHTHLAENKEDVAYSLEKFGCRPGQYAEDLGWTGDDVWHAHCVELDDTEIGLFAKTQTGVAHCPCSNCRLGSGIAPIRKMRDAGVPVGLGVDGSASNDSSNLIAEARQAMLLQRVQNGADALSAREALEIATLGGAQVLGRDDLGQIALGKRGDLVFWKQDTIADAGSWDAVSGLVLCGPRQAHHVMIEGKWVVRDGQLTRKNLGGLIAQQRQLALGLMG